jgi:hypothetical protein
VQAAPKKAAKQWLQARARRLELGSRVDAISAQEQAKHGETRAGRAPSEETVTEVACRLSGGAPAWPPAESATCSIARRRGAVPQGAARKAPFSLPHSPRGAPRPPPACGALENGATARASRWFAGSRRTGACRPAARRLPPSMPGCQSAHKQETRGPIRDAK